MENKPKPEYWQRGPLPDVPPLLQPVAHALLQARDEVGDLMKSFPSSLLLERPENIASCAFHLQHITGVLDRLFTYAHGKTLSDDQLRYLELEGKTPLERLESKILVESFSQQIEIAIQQLKTTSSETLSHYRPIGRLALPSTVIGLLFHASEHVMRHVGQLHVTSKIVLALNRSQS